MIIKTLAENTSISNKYEAEHGLSLYIETNKHKLLFDTGRGTLFLENAQKMGIDLALVDIAFISHGHFDHGGGLASFLNINKTAKVYLHEKAFGDYYSKRPNETAYIGLDKTLKENPRIILTKDFLQIDNQLLLFSGVKGKELRSLSNKVLLMRNNEIYVEDCFVHEQNLMIKENNKIVLFAGCAHNGIVNINQQLFEIFGRYADVVIGGFHLFNPSTKETESSELIKSISEKLKNTGSRYFTCHCTGQEAYRQLKIALGTQIEYLATGSITEI